MKRQPTADEMLLRMAGLCASSEHCPADIRDKILKQGFPSDIADKIIDYLIRNKYIDESRYARAFASDKVRFSGWGRVKVKMHLKSKRLPDSSINEGLKGVGEDDYIESLRKVLSAKARTLDLSEVKDRQKLYRHLASRGFESNIIISEMRKYLSCNGND